MSSIDPCEQLRTIINGRLSAIIRSPRFSTIQEPAAYVLLSGGKRLRPIMTLLFSRMLGGNEDDALAVACVSEMLHAASLILDDLPCMDNASMRRSLPACHIAYGEDIAILTALHMLSSSYGLLAERFLPLKAAIASTLFTSMEDVVGSSGLIGGQLADLRSTNKSPSYSVLRSVYQRKTCELFVFSCIGGAIIANASPQTLSAIRSFAMHFGMYYQMADDLQDIEVGIRGSADKDRGKDISKCTFINLTDRASNAEACRLLYEYAFGELSVLGESSATIRDALISISSQGILSKSGMLNTLKTSEGAVATEQDLRTTR